MNLRFPQSLFLAAGLLSSAHGAENVSEAPNRTLPELGGFQSERIDAAVPATARAVPKKPRRLLVCARTEGYYHESIPAGLHALVELGKRTGAFTVEINHEMSAFTAENLARFDGVLFLNTTQLKFENPGRRQALLEFVRHGGGLIGIHAASDNFPLWPEGQALMGGVFHSHPWVSSDLVAIKLDDPAHPVTQAFHGSGFWLREEMYQISGPYSRERQREVMSLDMSKPLNQRPADKIVRTDDDFPVAWLKREGEGRVFYTSLGHNETTFQTPEVLQHYLDGIQYALGDLEADATPTSALTAHPAPALAPEEPLELRFATTRALALSAGAADSVLALQPGGDRKLAGAIDQTLRGADAPTKNVLLGRLLAAAASSNSTSEGRRDFCHWFGALGDERAVPILGAWAKLPEGADDAVRALSTIPGGAAERQLVALLGEAPVRIQVYAALGKRAVSTVSKEALHDAESADHATAVAALAYLGLAGTSEAVRTLEGLKLQADREGSQYEALLTAAERLLALESDWSQPFLVRQAFNEHSPRVAFGALEILASRGGPSGLRLSFDALKKEAPATVRFATHWYRSALRSGGEEIAKLVSQRLTTLPENVQRALLETAEDSAAPEALPLITAALESPSKKVKVAAISALGTCGRDKAGIDKLVGLLDDKYLGAAALTALGRYPSPEVETRLNDLAAAKTPERLAPLLSIAAARVDRSLMPLVLKAAATEGESRKAAFKALSSLVRGEDLALLLDLRPQLKTAQERRAWQDALLTCVRFRTDLEVVAGKLADEFPKATTFERTAFSIALSLLETPRSTEAIKAELKSNDLDRRKDIVRALASARNLQAASWLADHMETASDGNEVILCLRGLTDTLSAFPEMNMPLKVKYYRRAWAVARLPEDRQAIIDTVDRLWGQDAKTFSEELHAVPTASKTKI